MSSTLPVWRLTRTAPARRLYDALASAGLRVAVLDRFRRGLPSAVPEASVPPGVEVEAVPAGDRPARWNVADPGLDPNHLVLAAVAEDELVGQAYLSRAGPVHVEALERTVDFEGGYLWGLGVEPAWRRQGIASALLVEALARLVRTDTRTVSALIAPDNVPSRGLFRDHGFELERRHVYVNAWGLAYRSSRSHAGEDSRGGR